MRTIIRVATLVSLLVSLIGLPCSVPGQNRELTAALRNGTINEVLRLLKENYVYPEVALKWEAAIRENQQRGEYDTITDGKKLAEKITADLRKIYDDKHLELSYSAEVIPQRSGKAGDPSPEEIEQARQRQRRQNFGVPKIEILKGNVGLIQINYFAPLDWAADVYPAAFGTVANTDALIIDVRRNSGSMDIDAVPFFSSYLFDRPVQVGDYFLRGANETRQLWTYARVPGRKYTDRPVYILMSGRTASGAEGFVRHMKQLKRATLVGEATMGATMPGMSHRVNDHFSIWISTGRQAGSTSENENKGIVPDVVTAADDALRAAHSLALDKILATASDESWKIELKKFRVEIDNAKNP